MKENDVGGCGRTMEKKRRGCWILGLIVGMTLVALQCDPANLESKIAGQGWQG